ncbi:MAG: hypothetical protein ACUVS7_14180, partial [Bryobacteraceae bacterium]
MKRLLTGLVLTPFFFYVVVFAPDVVFLATLAAVGFASYYEFLGIATGHLQGFEYDPRRNPAGYLAGLLLLLLPGSEILAVVLFALGMGLFGRGGRSGSDILAVASRGVVGRGDLL